MSLLLAPVQGVGLKIKRYRIINQQIDIVNNSGNSSVYPVVINDTTAVNTTANAYTQVKSYSISIPNNDFGRRVVNAVRVQIYGYVSAGTGYVEVLINGSAPTMLKTIVGTGNSNSFTNTSSALIFDGIISLPSSLSSPYTLSINAYNGTSGDITYIEDVYGFQGLAITSTTPVTIDQTETTPSNTILDEIGVSYANAGARLIIGINRYTSANATIKIIDQWNGGATYTPASANDAVNGIEVLTGCNFNLCDYGSAIPTGYNGSMTYTVTANVGASGDILIIGYAYVFFGFENINMPKGAHYGIIEDAYSAYNNTELTISGQYTCNSIFGCSGILVTVFSVNTSGWNSNGSSTQFALDEQTTIGVNSSSQLIHKTLLIEVLE